MTDSNDYLEYTCRWAAIDEQNKPQHGTIYICRMPLELCNIFEKEMWEVGISGNLPVLLGLFCELADARIFAKAYMRTST